MCAADEAGTEVTLLKEGAAEYKFYASGRRFCSGMAVTLDLRPRMDIFKGYVLNLLLPQDDIVDLEVPILSPVLASSCRK